MPTLIKTILIVLCLPSVTFSQTKNTKTTDEGVVINGVKWATRNVDMPGTFAETPESAGMFYQWNSKKAWNTTDSSVIGWDDTKPTGDVWGKINDPCPAGWRVPNLEEIKSLFDTVEVNDEWTSQNGISGRKFINITEDKFIFLPAVGFRESVGSGMLNYTNLYGFYWSSTRNIIYDTYILAFGVGGKSAWTNCYFGNACSLRCIAE